MTLASILPSIIAGLFVLISVWYTGRRASRNQVSQNRLQMEADAFSNAASYWKDKITGLESDVKSANEKIDQLLERGKQADLREQKLTRRIYVLEQTITDHGIDLPPWN